MDGKSTGSRLGPSPDLLGILFLIAAGFPLYWDRARDGRHLSRVDLVNQFLPNYTYLGERLRAGDLPGWNPYVNSGLPFLGDSVSGWGYLPAMVTFVVLPPLAALQANFMIHVWLAGLGAFALARVSSLSLWGALTAGIAYQYGSIVTQLRSVNPQAQLSAWLPLALLGVELAVTARTLRRRAIGWGIGGLATSQMVVGWTGQGSAYALLAVALYVTLRTIFQAVSHRSKIVSSVVRHIADGFAVLAFGIGLAAAGLWIRVVANHDSLIAGGNYERALGAQPRANYLHYQELLARLLRPSNYYYLGAATLSLACLAFFVVQRDRWRVWFYLTFAFIVVDLMVRQPVIRPILFAVPNFQELHEHSFTKGLILLGLPVSLLAGMTVDALSAWKRDWHTLLGLAFLPILAATAISKLAQGEEPALPPEPKKMMLTIGYIVGFLSLVYAARAMVEKDLFQVAKGLGILAILIAIAWDPFGDNFGRPLSGRVATLPPPKAFEVYLSRNDPNGPGKFLQQRMKEEGPFRFLGYGPSIFSTEGSRADRTYHGRFRDPLVVKLLFGRSMRLGLQSVQGYNPMQSERYTEFLLAVNGEPQNYHDANILRGGVDSPLLRLLNVRYIIVQREQAWKFEEIGRLEERYPTVYENGTVRILEVTDVMPRAWIVHEVENAPRDQVLNLIGAEEFDPASKAIIEGTLPKLRESGNPEKERVEIAHYSADRIELTANLTDPGLVVLSENFARGWEVFVNGKQATIYPTNYILRGVAVPAGKHTIEFRYAPPAIARGITVSLATAFVLVLLMVQPWQYDLRIIRWFRGNVKPLSRAERFGQNPEGAAAMAHSSATEVVSEPGTRT